MSDTAFTPAEVFAKLFDTTHGQLLAFLDETDEGEPAIMVIGADIGGVRPSAKLSGWPDGGQQKAFDQIDQTAAEKFTADFHNMLANLMDGQSS